MRPKAIRDLIQLSDKAFFEQISIGIQHVLNNSNRINNGAQSLYEKKLTSAAHILSAIAGEEAAKCLILMDAVRCPHKMNDVLAIQLNRFNEHLAKGLYAKACYWKPTDFKELQDYLENDRQEFYLDGPNDIDWIFRNRVIADREETIYVDYVAEDNGEHYWQTPYEDILHFSSTPEAVTLANALFDTGCTSPKALEIIADFWRPMTINLDFKWSELCELNRKTLELLDEKGLISEQPPAIYSTIISSWPFPMFSIDLKEIKVDQTKLREKQNDWIPDW